MDNSPPDQKVRRRRGRPPTERALQTVVRQAPFDAAVAIAIAEISPIANTRSAYRRDFEVWEEFCADRDVNREQPIDGAVVAFVAWLEHRGEAPKTRARRLSSMASIFRELRRKKIVEGNPFSADEGPRRAKAPVLEPTPIADNGVVERAIAACGAAPLDIRDAAIMRALWSTGMRRASLLSMTHEKLARDPAGYVATVVKKGGEDQRVLVTGKAAETLARWLAILRDGCFKSGPIWRDLRGEPLSFAELGRALKRRGRVAGGDLSPHMFRVAFLTHNKAGIEAKQDAAGHADPATTRLYDRDAWRGREAFEKMPDPEEVT